MSPANILRRARYAINHPPVLLSNENFAKDPAPVLHIAKDPTPVLQTDIGEMTELCLGSMNDFNTFHIPHCYMVF